MLRAVLVLVSGTGVAHLITALSLPILTRLYTPEDFSVLAFFSGVLMTVSVAACLRLDVAIPLARNDEEARDLLILSLLATGLVSFLLLLFILFVPSWVLILPDESVKGFTWLLLTGVLMAGVYNAFQNWFIRQKAFVSIAQSRVIQAFASNGVQIGNGLFGANTYGLLFGYMLNVGMGSILLGARWFANAGNIDSLSRLTFYKLKTTFLYYKNFPKFSTGEALANSASVQIPIMMIASFSIGADAGYLLLGMTVIQAPMAILGTSLSQVFSSRAPAEYREGRLGNFVLELLGNLLKVGAGPLLAVGILSPAVFELIFGFGWSRAGVLVAWMVPWFILQFLVSPISVSLHVVGRLRLALVLQLFGVIFRVMTVWLAYLYAQESIGEIYAVTGGIFYLIYLVSVIYVLEINFFSLLGLWKKSIVILVGWGALALLLRGILFLM